ncbi:MAG: cytochrome c oxidase assembly protein, partial [Gemmatimonadales bacterium]
PLRTSSGKVRAVARMPVLAMLHPFTQLGWLAWSIHPSTVIGLAVLVAIYLWRASKATPEETVAGPRKLSFFAALFVIFASLNGPLHDLSDDYLFSAHMVQHLLLTLAMPPLLIAGIPGWMLRPLLRNRAAGAIARRITKPIVCFSIFNIVIAAWHVPALYNLAMANHNVHIVEHLMFMAAAVLMWWPLMSPLPELPRLAYPGQMLYCFLMSVPMSIVAVYITMADQVLYPAYASAPRISPLSPMDDQMLGGLIMWVPGGLIFALIMTVVFFKWAARGEDSTAGAQVDWKPRAA